MSGDVKDTGWEKLQFSPFIYEIDPEVTESRSIDVGSNDLDSG